MVIYQQFNIDSNILLNLLRKIKFLYNDLTYNYSKYNNLSNEEFYNTIIVMEDDLLLIYH